MTYRTHGRFLLSLCLPAFLLLTSSAVRADDAAVQSEAALSTTSAETGGGPQLRSGRKFFARGGLGAGWVALTQDEGDAKIRLGGVGMYWDLALGVTVWRGLSVHGSYFGGYAWDPTTKIGGVEQSSDDRTSLAVLGLGPGVTYTFDPYNLYVSYSVGAGWSVLQFHHNNSGAEPAGWGNVGFANQIVIGKEWLIDDGFSLGVGVQGLYARVLDEPTKDDEVKYNSFGGSALLSATYR